MDSNHCLLDRTNEECIKEHYNLHIKTSIYFTHLIDESPVIDLDQTVNDEVISVEKDEYNKCFNRII